jgi:hypothetical protein
MHPAGGLTPLDLVEAAQGGAGGLFGDRSGFDFPIGLPACNEGAAIAADFSPDAGRWGRQLSLQRSSSKRSSATVAFEAMVTR